jgi:hypothetical protein
MRWALKKKREGVAELKNLQYNVLTQFYKYHEEGMAVLNSLFFLGKYIVTRNNNEKS